MFSRTSTTASISQASAAGWVQMDIDIMENKVLGPAILKGEANMLASLLEERFGALPEWVAEKLGNAKEPQLMAWGRRLLSVLCLQDVFKD